MEAKVDGCENFELAIDQSILIDTQSSRVVYVILETNHILVNEEPFLIIFVCENETSKIEPMKEAS